MTTRPVPGYSRGMPAGKKSGKPPAADPETDDDNTDDTDSGRAPASKSRKESKQNAARQDEEDGDTESSIPVRKSRRNTADANEDEGGPPPPPPPRGVAGKGKKAGESAAPLDDSALLKAQLQQQAADLIRSKMGQPVEERENEKEIIFPRLKDLNEKGFIVRPGSSLIEYGDNGKGGKKRSSFWNWYFAFFTGDVPPADKLPRLPPIPEVKETKSDQGVKWAYELNFDGFKEYKVPWTLGATNRLVFEVVGKLSRPLEMDPTTKTISANIQMTDMEEVRKGALWNRRIRQEFEDKKSYMNDMRLVGIDPVRQEPYPTEPPFQYRSPASQFKHKGMVYLGGEFKTKEEKDEEKKREDDAILEWNRNPKKGKWKGPKVVDPIDLVLNHPEVKRNADYISAELTPPYKHKTTGQPIPNYHLMDAVSKTYLGLTDFQPGNLVKMRIEIRKGTHDWSSEGLKKQCVLLVRYDTETFKKEVNRHAAPFSGTAPVSAPDGDGPKTNNKKRGFKPPTAEEDDDVVENGSPAKKARIEGNRSLPLKEQKHQSQDDDGDENMTDAKKKTGGKKSTAMNDDDEAPPARGKKSTPAHGDDVPPPRGRKSAPAHDDEPPARGKKSAPAHDDDEPPARGKKPVNDDDEPPTRGKKSTSEDDAPTTRNKKQQVDREESSPPPRSGKKSSSATRKGHNDDE